MKTIRFSILGIAALSLLAIAILGSNASPAQALTGSYGIHDPSVIQVGSCFYAFGTGDNNVNHGNIRILKSCGGLSGSWAYLNTVFTNIPSWIPGVIGTTPGNLWAPDINYINGQYRLYYAASTFGSNNSVIGLATASNIEGPWSDAGEVFHSTSSNNYNAIDPDYIEGKLAFGSFWDGIKMIDIGADGKRSGTAMYNLASRGGGAIEAASIVHEGSFYYLFVSFDTCCQGVNSTYRTMVGRSSSLTGPYSDQNGTAMMSGGATQLLATNGNEIGPGGGDASSLPGYYAYHYYDGAANGAAKLNIRPITYSNGWPVLGAPIPNGCCATPTNTNTPAVPTNTPTRTNTPPAAPTNTPAQGSTTYQAESALVGGGNTIDTNHTGYNGSGFVNFSTSGGYVEFQNVNGTGGSQTIQFRNALGTTSSRTGQLVVNGATQNITFNPTASWDTWVTLDVLVTLNAGTSNTIRLQSNGQDLANIDEMVVVAGGSNPTNTPAAPTNTPTRTNTPVGPTNTPLPPTNTPTRTNTPVGPTNTPLPPTNTPTRTNTPVGPTNTPVPTNTPTQGSGGGTCSPVDATISAPFTKDGAGTFCWQSSNLGSYTNNWNMTSLTINGVDFTNIYVGSGSYPAQIGGYWYVAYNGPYAWSHFEAK